MATNDWTGSFIDRDGGGKEAGREEPVKKAEKVGSAADTGRSCPRRASGVTSYRGGLLGLRDVVQKTPHRRPLPGSPSLRRHSCTAR